MQEPEMLATEAARAIGVSPRRITQLADSGELQCTRVGARGVRVFRAADVEALRDQRAARKTRDASDSEASK